MHYLEKAYKALKEDFNLKALLQFNNGIYIYRIDFIYIIIYIYWLNIFIKKYMYIHGFFWCDLLLGFTMNKGKEANKGGNKGFK